MTLETSPPAAASPSPGLRRFLTPALVASLAVPITLMSRPMPEVLAAAGSEVLASAWAGAALAFIVFVTLTVPTYLPRRRWLLRIGAYGVGGYAVGWSAAYLIDAFARVVNLLPDLGLVESFALMLGAVIAAVGLMLLVGTRHVAIATAFNLESGAKDRAMMAPAGLSCLAEGLLMILAAVALSTGPEGAVAQAMLGVAVALVALAGWAHWASWRAMDELNRAMWNDATAIAAHVTIGALFLWVVAQAAGLVGVPDPLALITAFYLVYLVAALAVAAVRSPGVLEMQPGDGA